MGINGSALLDEAEAGRLFADLFRSYFGKFNLGYVDVAGFLRPCPPDRRSFRLSSRRPRPLRGTRPAGYAVTGSNAE